MPSTELDENFGPPAGLMLAGGLLLVAVLALTLPFAR